MTNTTNQSTIPPTMTSTTKKEQKARKLLAEARRKTIEADRLLDGHVARIFAARATVHIDAALEWLQEPASKEGQ